MMIYPIWSFIITVLCVLFIFVVAIAGFTFIVERISKKIYERRKNREQEGE